MNIHARHAAIVGKENNDGIIVDAQGLELLQYIPKALIHCLNHARELRIVLALFNLHRVSR